jgi:transglutaminase-like putative cysteine protease
MHNFRTKLLGAVLLLFFGFYLFSAIENLYFSTPNYDDEAPAPVELANIRAMIIAREPRFSDIRDANLAIALRDYVYQNVPVRRPDGTAPSYYDLDNYVFLSLYDNQDGALCGGLALNYLMIAKAFDLQARFVGIYNRSIDAPTPVLSHAGVEIFLDGKWVIMDPTWNFSVTDRDGNLLGWADVRDQRGDVSSLVFTENGMNTYDFLPDMPTTGRSLNAYYPDISKLTDILNFLVFSGSEISDPEILPRNWDGQIRYLDGNVYDAQAGNSGGIYEIIATVY